MVVLDGPLTIGQPDLDPQSDQYDLMEAVRQLDDATPGYQRADAYFTGTVPEFFASVRLRRAMLRSGASFRFNFAKIAVDAVTERLQIAAVTSTDTGADNALREIWLRNKMALQSREIIKRACEFGDAYVVVWPSPDDDGVDIHYNSAQCMRLFYDLENPLKKSYAVKRWDLPGPKKQKRADLYYPDRIERYITKPGSVGNKLGDWLPYEADGTDAVLVNPYGQIPVFHFRTEQPYGVPEHKGFYGPQDAIHKLILSHMAGVDYQAFPQRYALVHPDADTTEAAAEDEDTFAFADTGTGATIPPMGEGRSQYTSDPGSLWFMRGTTGVGQFDVADHGNFTEPMLVYLRMGSEVTNTPLHRVDPTGDAPSGESLRTAEAPFVHKIEDRQLSFGDTAREMFNFALLVHGTGGEVTVRWVPAQTVNDLEGWQTVAAKLTAGVPAEQAFLEAGYSNEQVEAWFGTTDRDMPFNVDLLLKIGQALAALGTAQSLGVIDGPQLQQLIESVIPVAQAEADAT